MKTTHGAAAAAEMARMENESGKSGTLATKTFKDARSALANAKRLYEKGEITKAEYSRLEKKLGKQAQSQDLDEYLNKTYVRRR